MTGDAEMVERHDAVVTVVLAAGRDAAEQVRHFGKLRDAWVDARECVGGVVDDDRDGELIELGRRGAQPGGHAGHRSSTG